MATPPKLNPAAWWSLGVVAAGSLVSRALGHGPHNDVLLGIAFVYSVLFIITLGRPTRAFKSEYLEIDDEEERARHDARAWRYAFLLFAITLPAMFLWLWHASP
jgi:hypothetical protein